MNNIFNQQNQQNELAVYQRQYNTARYDLLVIIAFSLVNIFLILFGQDVYFLFSAYIPFSFVATAALATGRYPDDFYRETGISIEDFWGEDYEMMEPMFGAIFAVMVVISLAILGFYLLCFFLSKKHPAWMIVAAVVFGIDTLYLLSGGISGMIVDLVFHIIMMVILIRGCIYGRKLKAYNEAMKAAQYAQPGQFGAGPYDAGFGANGDPYYGNPGMNTYQNMNMQGGPQNGGQNAGLYGEQTGQPGQPWQQNYQNVPQQNFPQQSESQTSESGSNSENLDNSAYMPMSDNPDFTQSRDHGELKDDGVGEAPDGLGDESRDTGDESDKDKKDGLN